MLDGLDRLDELNAQDAAHRPRGTPYGNLRVLSVADVDTATPRGYLLKGIMSPGELSLWVGPPKCGKSFLMLYIAYLLSLGRPVFGLRVKRTRVLYTAAEGEGGIANRIRALRDYHGASHDFFFIAQPTDLLHEPGHKGDLKSAAKGCRAELIVIDTVNRVLAGGDENSSEDMGALILYMAELRQETGAHVAAVHHGTKASGGSTPRGHSCLTGADDALIEITRHEDGSRSAKIVHAKDDSDGHAFRFTLKSVDLGTDEDGDPVTTLTVEELDAAPTREAEALTGNEKAALRTLEQAMKASGQMAAIGDDGAERQVVHVEHWRAWFYRECKPGDSQDAKKKAFQRVRDGLLSKGLIVARDDFIWRPNA
jgi:RecA-family ATPase